MVNPAARVVSKPQQKILILYLTVLCSRRPDRVLHTHESRSLRPVFLRPLFISTRAAVVLIAHYLLLCLIMRCSVCVFYCCDDVCLYFLMQWRTQ